MEDYREGGGDDASRKREKWQVLGEDNARCKEEKKRAQILKGN